jgi:flavin-dependent dehydrogenase
MTAISADADVLVVGGGPAGAVASSLLAARGHSVLLAAQPRLRDHELANSLPPSTRKLLAGVRTLEIVDRVGLKTTGNTVWWGSGDRRVEPFDPTGREFGYQVLRSALDPQLLAHARATGVHVYDDTVVRRVTFKNQEARLVASSSARGPLTATGRIVLDCSGRAGVVARRGFRRQRPDVRMQALLGAWEQPAWNLTDATHTIVETYEAGWAWSIPVSPTVRHVGTMIDGAVSGVLRGSTLAATYRSELAKSRQLDAHVARAKLQHVWACDASVYSSVEYGNESCLLVGDAGSTIDPLSSYGVKKALASAWLASVVAHTCLVHPERQALALRFFADWEERVYATYRERSRVYAVEAYARHPSRFWETRASQEPATTEQQPTAEAMLRLPAVVAAYEAMRNAGDVTVRRNPEMPFVQAPLVRDGEIVAEDAIHLPGAAPVRYVHGLDLLTICSLASERASVPDLFEAVHARVSHVSLPQFLGALAVLVASRALATDPPLA